MDFLSFYELAYLESVSQGNSVTKGRIEDELKFRKPSVEGWDDSLKEQEENLQSMQNNDNYSEDNLLEQTKELDDMKIYVQRYYELWTACTEGAGISEEEYWKEVVPYIKKGSYIAIYDNERYESYEQKEKPEKRCRVMMFNPNT